MIGRAVGGVCAAVVLFLVYGAIVEGNSKARTRDAIELCHRKERQFTGSAEEKSVLSRECRKIEHELKIQLGYPPVQADS